MSDETSTKPKDLHEDSDYPAHHPNKGVIEPSGSGNIFSKLWKKLFG